jgi:hypothetical protein
MSGKKAKEITDFRRSLYRVIRRVSKGGTDAQRPIEEAGDEMTAGEWE